MRKLIFPILLIALSVFLVFWFVEPTYSEVSVIQDRTAEYETALNRAEELQQTLNQKLETRDGITDNQLARLNTMLPDTIDTVRFLIELDRIAATHGMSIEGMSYSGVPEAYGGSAGGQATGGEGESASAYNTMQASFNTSGSYGDIQDFLADIQRSARLMDVTSFNLATETDDENLAGVGVNQYSITLDTYWRNNS